MMRIFPLYVLRYSNKAVLIPLWVIEGKKLRHQEIIPEIGEKYNIIYYYLAKGCNLDFIVLTLT